MRNIILVLLFPFSLFSQSQGPLNDGCPQSQPIDIGSKIEGIANLSATQSPEESLPLAAPFTCIKSYENDLWYQIENPKPAFIYQFILTHNICETPAGMQVIVFESENCAKKNFVSLACASFESTDEIKLDFTCSGGKPVFIMVDGFDGNNCNFNIELIKSDANPSEESYYIRNRFDHSSSLTPTLDYPDYDGKFINNVFNFSWTAPATDDAKFYVLQKVKKYTHLIDHFVAVNKMIIPTEQTALGTETVYYAEDYPNRAKQGEEICYRVIKVTDEGEQYYGETMCSTIDWIEDFYLGKVSKSQTPGVYSCKYINKGKKKNLYCTVLNEKGKVVKETVLKKEPVRDGTLSLNMEGFSEGDYILRMSNGKHFFERSFIIP